MSLNLWIFGLCSLLLGAIALTASIDPRFPGDNRGYEPEQPIAFSHRLHAGEMGMDCQYCHFGARRSRHAGVPPASVCMNCHKTVTSGLDAFLQEKERAEAEEREPEVVLSAEIAELFDHLALDPEGNPVPGQSPRPVEWVRVHNLPDFVYFDHRPHVARGVACESCHGPVQGMERMRQETSLSMGWCLDCHRKSQADAGALAPPAGAGRVPDHVSTNCVTCHL